MGVLNRSDLEKRAKDRRFEVRKIKGLGDVNIRRLNGNEAREITEYQQRLRDTEDVNIADVWIEFQMAIVALCWADEKGERMFGNSEEEIRELGAALLNDDIAKLAQECLKVNGMDAKEAEEISGKSEKTETGDSPSSSA